MSISPSFVINVCVCACVYNEYIYVTLNFVPFPLLSPYHVTYDVLALEESIYVTGHQAEG